jgi:hypothetical protein
MSVTPIPVAAVVTLPDTASVVVTDSRQFTAEVRDVSGRLLSGRAVTWAASPTSVATISSSGLLTALAVGTVTVTASSEGKSGQSTVTVRPIPPGGYRIGVNYHATGEDITETAFLRHYHNPAVRALVLQQLQGMAAAGADLLKTALWFVGGIETTTKNAIQHRFPISQQELMNIRAYVTDVAGIHTRSGRPLHVQLAFGYLWCADYTFGDASTGVGQCNLPWSTFVANTKQSVLAILQTVAEIRATDGTPVVERIYLDGEVMVGAKKNQEQFLKDLWPWFVTTAAGLGLKGSLYFITAAFTEQALDSTYRDSAYPEINGRLSLYWIIRSVTFLKNNDLPIPEVLATSFYPGGWERWTGGSPGTIPIEAIIQRVLDDIDAVFPGKRVSVAETIYPMHATDRRRVGRAFATAFYRRPTLEDVIFWTAPNGAGMGMNAAYPFVFDDYR